MLEELRSLMSRFNELRPGESMQLDFDAIAGPRDRAGPSARARS
jgi:hypothetical protein